MKLSSEQEHLVLENRKLVYYSISKLGIPSYFPDYEDIVSIGTIGLVKAAITFDTSRNINFSTYATKCINNELFIHFRKNNKYENDISIDEVIGDDNELTLLDTFADPKSDFVEDLIKNEEFTKVIMIILNRLKGLGRITLLYRMAGFSQLLIAKKSNVSRSYIAEIEKQSIKKLKKFISLKSHYKEVFSMGIEGDEYKISFSTKDVSQFNRIFAELLKKQSTINELPDFKVNCNNERVIIQVPAHPDSFSFIAQIIQEIDSFSMKYVSNKSKLYANDTNNEINSEKN